MGKKEQVKNPGKKRGLYRFLDWVERVGNKLPSPFMLFVILILLVMILSAVLSTTGLSVTYERGVDGELVETTVSVTNLLSRDVITSVLANFTSTYVGFAPLGLVLVMTMGIGLIEYTGLISALMRKSLLGAPPVLVTAVLAFVGINANIASDVGMIFSAAIGGALFKALGRNPKLGVIVGFSAASGGFTANILIAGTDSLLAGISQTVVESNGIEAVVNPTMNWFFMIVATFVLTGVTVLVADKISMKSEALGAGAVNADAHSLAEHQVTKEENRGLRFAAIAAILYIGLLLVCLVPKNGFLRGDDGGIISSPFMSGIVAVLFFFFAATGISYGIGAKTIKGEGDVAKLMQKSVEGSSSFLVVALSASLFIELFNQSGLITILAVNGASLISSLNVNIIPLLILFILLTTFINLFTISGSIKWLILAPIFIPMFATVGISPAATQVAYRIGDSCTNIISPLSPYIPVVIGILNQYKTEDEPSAGVGTVISYTLPYSMAYLVAMIILLIIFIIFKLPLGPGAGIYI